MKSQVEFTTRLHCVMFDDGTAILDYGPNRDAHFRLVKYQNL